VTFVSFVVINAQTIQFVSRLAANPRPARRGSDRLKLLPLQRALAFALFLTTPAVAEEAGPPASFFVGHYEIVGRSPGVGGHAYSGWTEVKLDGEKLSIVRCVEGKKSDGTWELASATADHVRVIRARFELDGKALEATCQVHVDLDNYGRLTCYTYPAGEPAIATPGIEALFHAKWSRPAALASCP
jgi:hypothetical protein